MTDPQPTRVSTPLDRLVASLSAWEKVPHPPRPRRVRLSDRDRLTLDQAKGAVMRRYGVSSHIAFAMIARWSRTDEVPIMTLAAALVAGAAEDRDLSDDQLLVDTPSGGGLIGGG